ncbi:hypothetical protein SISSUDRAFT_1121013 [Sistotremastrum suecicum HHB10207 ss-3]|uniref:Uncharacterized protein n=1 Tax=Sistotremastrum suecicum HHB10207 ss-3 TaxID=1314776 RepID=A0A166BG17_9AGAM|nr:hypothetical protein SISSUDRAFT_1121013 [Sistotremastrum suecicum HHB10207 ss-3]
MALQEMPMIHPMQKAEVPRLLLSWRERISIDYRYRIPILSVNAQESVYGSLDWPQQQKVNVFEDFSSKTLTEDPDRLNQRTSMHPLSATMIPPYQEPRYMLSRNWISYRAAGWKEKPGILSEGGLGGFMGMAGCHMERSDLHNNQGSGIQSTNLIGHPHGERPESLGEKQVKSGWIAVAVFSDMPRTSRNTTNNGGNWKVRHIPRRPNLTSTPLYSRYDLTPPAHMLSKAAAASRASRRGGSETDGVNFMVPVARQPIHQLYLRNPLLTGMR